VREEALSRSWRDVRAEAEGNRGRNHPVYAAGKACSRAGGQRRRPNRSAGRASTHHARHPRPPRRSGGPDPL
jgi:hypothetical protein